MSMGGDVLLERGLLTSGYTTEKNAHSLPQKPLTSYKGWSHMSLPTLSMMKWDSLVLGPQLEWVQGNDDRGMSKRY